MRRLSFMTCLMFLATAAAGRIAPQPLSAQTGIARGKVVDALTGRPIAGATITIADSKTRGRTAGDGTYVMTKLRPGELLVRLEAKGYTSSIEEIVINEGWSTSVDFELTPMVATLEAMIIDQKIRKPSSGSSNSISGQEAQAAGSVIQALGGRLPGVQILTPTSEGGMSRIRMRGPHGINLPDDPVIYVDGVRVNAGPRSAPRGRGSNTGGSMFDFVELDAIERIEILRGPATALQYGLDAANGVVLIWTRHGEKRP